MTMSIDSDLLKILVCPDDRSALCVAEPALIVSLNSQIEQGALKNRAGRLVTERIDSGLIRADGKFMYPIRDDIPIMLIDEAIKIG